MVRRAWLRGGATLLCVSLAVAAVAACAAFDESGGDTSAEGGANAEAAAESGGALDGGTVLDGDAEATTPIDVLTDAGSDAATTFGPDCTVGEQRESESNDITGNPFNEEVCGNLTPMGDVDILTLVLARTAVVSVTFARSGDAQYTLQGQSVNLQSGPPSNDGINTVMFPGKPGGYTITITGSPAQSWNIKVHQD